MEAGKGKLGSIPASMYQPAIAGADGPTSLFTLS